MDNAELKSSQWKALVKWAKREMAPVCWWCGKPIDLKLSANDKWSWTLDHVKPRWSHPHLTFERSNLRPAHRKCNSERAGRAQVARASRTYG